MPGNDIENLARHHVDIDKILSRHSHIDDRYIAEYDELREVVNELKERGLRIVLTQGVYDLLHEGHAKYLERALSYGDVLIVGVDTDAYTRERKGPSRPVVPFQERLNMLAHLRHVSILTQRDVVHGKGELIELVCPHVLITSESTKDFPAKDVKMYEQYTERIITLPPQGTTSTTARIRHLTIDGADSLAKELHKRIPLVVQESLDHIRNRKL
jgi:D-beta-D-heptose 7-phosphate kinase/D-beta-D-heptose 1-phosphate adenosyltransferase